MALQVWHGRYFMEIMTAPQGVDLLFSERTESVIIFFTYWLF